jgi:hypothetical protein
VQPGWRNCLDAGVVPQRAVALEIDEAQIGPDPFRRGTDAAEQRVGRAGFNRKHRQVQKAQAGQRLVDKRRKKMPSPCVSLPDLPITTSSPVSRQTPFAPPRCCLISCQRNAGHSIFSLKNAAPPGSPRRFQPSGTGRHGELVQGAPIQVWTQGA